MQVPVGEELAELDLVGIEPDEMLEMGAERLLVAALLEDLRLG